MFNVHKMQCWLLLVLKELLFVGLLEGAYFAYMYDDMEIMYTVHCTYMYENKHLIFNIPITHYLLLSGRWYFTLR